MYRFELIVYLILKNIKKYILDKKYDFIQMNLLLIDLDKK